MSFALSYIAKVALALDIIADMMDLSYFGFENNRFFYNLAGTIIWVTLVNFIFNNDFISWILVIGAFIFRTTLIISRKKSQDEKNKDSGKK
jgi:hypothetical protein